MKQLLYLTPEAEAVELQSRDQILQLSYGDPNAAGTVFDSGTIIEYPIDF